MLAHTPQEKPTKVDAAPGGAIGEWPIGRITSDDEGRIRSANPAAAALLARLGGGRGQLFAALAALGPGLSEAAQGLAPGRVLQRRVATAEGAALALELRRTPCGFEVVWVDETPRRRAEAEAARHAARFEAVAEAAERAGVFALDAAGHVSAWSRSAARFEGLSASEALGRNFTDILARRRPSLDAAALLGQAAARGECAARREDASAFAPADLTLRALRAPDGSLDGFVVVVRDGETAAEELRRLAETDPLTGVLNRRAFFATAEAALSAARLRGEPMALIAFDLDDFKGLNDRLGHAAGDAALQALTETARRDVRDGDLLGRLGGDEFAIALPRADAARALRIAERLRGRLERARAVTEVCAARMTASFGVAAAAGAAGVAELLARADAALYRAKGAGKNRVAMG